MEAASADHGHHQKKSLQAGAHHGGENNGKSRADLYAGAVAQRALFGPSRCRGGAPRRAADAGNNGKLPSRLSKMSGAAEAT